uniref:G-protein coupled receptors family 1 profile domain-containing protein n=1 Tax=Plectus sambesii TaxID=2011161 RepID=A0A914WBH2_9BILA
MTYVDVLAMFVNIFMFITVPIYILMIITLVKNRREETLKHSFYSLVISIGIADIGAMLSVFFNIVASFAWIPSFYLALGDLASRIYNTCAFFFSAAQVIGVFVIGLNRFTAYMLPMSHQEIWDHGKWLRVVVVLQWLIAFGNVIPIMFVWEFNILTSDNKTTLFQWTNGVVADNWNTYNSIMIKGQNDWLCVNLDTFWLLVNGGTCMFSTITPYALIGLCTPIRERFFEMWCGFIVKKKSTNVAMVTESQPEEQKPRNQAIQQNRHR